MAPHEQVSSSSAGVINAATNQASPRMLARAPLWARLPALRTMAGTVFDSQSQAHGQDSPAAPPIVLPDRISTTRILLNDTQACVQKLSARMDMLGSRIEQALKEFQLAREALDTGGDKTVAEIADVVYKCQAALTKSIEMQGNALDKINNDLAKLTISSEAHFKLYEMQSASLASLTHAMQSVQAQHVQLVGALAPLEPLVRAIPMHIDALVPTLERTIECALERALSKSPMGAYMREQSIQESFQTPRGQKRKRAVEESMRLAEPARLRRRSTFVPFSASAQTTHEPSSPLLNRSRSGIWNSERLQSRASLRIAGNENVPAPNAGTDAADEAPTPALPLQAPARPVSRRTTRRPTVGPSNEHKNFNLADKRPRADSTAHIVADIDAALIPPGTPLTLVGTTPGMAGESVTNGVSAPIRLTRSATKTGAQTKMVTPSCVPLGTRQLESPCALPSANNGQDGADKAVVPQSVPPLEVGSENVRQGNIDKDNSGSLKTKTKTPKKVGGGTAKGKGKGKAKKKASGSADTNVFYAPLSVAETPAVHPIDTEVSTSNLNFESNATSNSKSLSKETSPKRTITADSGSSIMSVALVHGPPNSPSTHPISSPIPSNENNGPEKRAFAPIPKPPVPNADTNATLTTRTLISLIDASQESSFPIGRIDDGTQDGAGLAAALAHVDRDINFVSDLGIDPRQEKDMARNHLVRDFGNTDTLDGFRLTGSSPTVVNTLFRGRPKRFLAVDNNSTELDLLDELFIE